ncbi:hypothetical protein AB0C31_33030, partial [Actinoplanes philippinensis]
RLLAVTWGTLSPDFLTYHGILRALLQADREITGGENVPIIRACFAWREIAPVPTSLLLRQHTITACGFTAGKGPTFAESGAPADPQIPAPRVNGVTTAARL